MSDILYDEKDGNLPEVYSDLSDWHWFCFRNIGPDSEATLYLEELIRQHGADYEVALDPDLFLDHIGRVAFANDQETMRNSRLLKEMK